MPRNSFYDGNAGDAVAIDNSAAAAATSETNAATSATNAATSETNAAASYDSFDDRYLGVKSSGPTLDNDGDALVDGALYFDTTTNTMMVYDLGGTTWNRTTPTTSDQTKINTVSGIQANVTTVAGVSGNVTTVAGVSSNVTTVAGISANVTTVAGIAANVTAVAGDAADIGAVAGKATEIGRLGTTAVVADLDILGTAAIVTDMDLLATSANVTNMATLGASGVVGNVATVAGISSNVTTVAGISANTTTVAGISGNVTTVAGISANTTTVAGIASNVTSVAGNATNINAVAADATDIGAVAGKATEIGRLGTAAAVADLAILGTAAIVTDMDILGTSANVTAMGTVATNIAGVNSFADRYRVATVAPTTSLDEGDLYFNTTDNKMYRYNGTSWAEIVTYSAGTGVSISGSNVISASAIALTTVQTAANQTAHLALTAQEGDVVVRSDEKKTYVKNSGSAGTMADFTLLQTPTDAVTSVNGSTGVVTLTHDGFSDFVTDEHLDWTADQGAKNIHTGNYTNTTYTHPTHAGDDIDVDTTALTGATVVSDIDINVTTDTLGHVTDANGAISTRTLTLADLSYTGATDANNYSLTTASSSVLGGIKVGTNLSIASGVLSSTDTNTTYLGGTGITLTGTTFATDYGTTTGTAAEGNHTHSGYEAEGTAVAMAIALG